MQKEEYLGQVVSVDRIIRETSLKILRREQTVQVSGGEHSSPKVLHMQRP